MQFFAKLFLGIFTAFFSFSILSFTRHGLLDSAWPLLLTFVGPILIPIIFLFLPTVRKTLGASFIVLGVSLASMPIGLRKIVDEAGTAFSESEVHSAQEEVTKGLLLEAFDSFAAGVVWFGPLAGLLLILSGWAVWTLKEQ